MNKQSLTINFTLDEINLLLEVLGKEPYAKVFQIIGKIQEEAQHQLSNGQAKEADLTVAKAS